MLKNLLEEKRCFKLVCGAGNEDVAEIEKAMYATPYGKLPKFSHPVIEQAVKNYGWKSIHEVMADDFHTMQAQLRRMYDECAKKYIENKRNKEILEGNPLLGNAINKLALQGGEKHPATRKLYGAD